MASGLIALPSSRAASRDFFSQLSMLLEAPAPSIAVPSFRIPILLRRHQRHRRRASTTASTSSFDPALHDRVPRTKGRD